MPRKEKAVKPVAQVELTPAEVPVVAAPVFETEKVQPARAGKARAAKTKTTKAAKTASKKVAKTSTPQTAVGKAKTVKAKTAKVAEPKAAKTAKPKTAKAVKAAAPAARSKAAKVVKPKAKKAPKAKKPQAEAPVETAQLLSSEVVFDGKLFRVLHDQLIEPGGKPSERDVIRHNGSVVILAIDSSKSKKDPYVVVERQYRHAANQYLWELPAGKLDAGEEALAGAQRELSEETGYSAKKWKPLVEYFASPGFLGESMKVFLAEGLIAGDAHPEEDETIEIRLVKLSEVLRMIDKGAILDGKTLTSVLLYERKLAGKRKK